MRSPGRVQLLTTLDIRTGESTHDNRRNHSSRSTSRKVTYGRSSRSLPHHVLHLWMSRRCPRHHCELLLLPPHATSNTDSDSSSLRLHSTRNLLGLLHSVAKLKPMQSSATSRLRTAISSRLTMLTAVGEKPQLTATSENSPG